MITVISGATGGVGTATAELFASKGNNLVLLGRNHEKLSSLAKRIEDLYNIDVHLYECSVEDRESLSNAIKKINLLSKNLVLLINIAGVFPYGPLMNETEIDYNNCMDVNLRLPYLLSKGLFTSLEENGGGKIINIGSSSSYSGFRNTVTYCASKHALLGFSRALNDEWKESGVSVHCISPGTINTEMANILDQDKSTYIEVDEVAELIYDVSRYKGNMIVDEVRAIRKIIR